MADAEYDVVIAGAGTKALTLGLYLNKFGGMKVAMFERRHEAGGGMAGEETPAPGFLHAPHAIGEGGLFRGSLYWNTIFRDFPEECEEFNFETGNIAHYPIGVTFPDHRCMVVTCEELDPDQTKTAELVSRFSKKDADTWLKMIDPYKRQRCEDALLRVMYNPPSLTSNPIAELYADPKMELDPSGMFCSFRDMIWENFESPQMRIFALYILTSCGMDPYERGNALPLPAYWAWMLTNACFARGNVHHNAHALVKMNLSMGNKIFTNSEVDRIVLENGTAKGIRLLDGTEIGAKQMVVTNVDPTMLAFRFIGRENLSEKIARKIDRIERSYITCTWYGWAVHEKAKYLSAEFHPKVGEVAFLGIVSNDPEDTRWRDYCRAMGYLPKDEHGNTKLHLAVAHQPTCEGSAGIGIIAPEGKEYYLTEQFIWPGNQPGWDEKRWLAWKREHAEDVIRVWSERAPNMTW
ncbi:MAG: NAD(P)/FAD-dependent oxidoreductase, partial [Chloroflexi bacterium]|nr:NAD(P)/FAD-dependent oxidoreductase [Chloroflexota bacterium]